MSLIPKIPELKKQFVVGAHGVHVSKVKFISDVPAVIVSFSDGIKTHEKFFYLQNKNNVYLKMLSILGINIQRRSFSEEEIIGKKIVIIVQDMDSDMRITNFKPYVPNKKYRF